MVDAGRLASTLWDLPAWVGRSRELLGELERLSTITQPSLAPGFVLSAAVLRHLQSDPLLPTELLPERWPGTALRATYDDWDRRYRAALRAWARDAPSGTFGHRAAVPGG